ncbi:hypothetical protein ILUMI_12782 [Ignelater luminosus]|uniref:Uncharacterized protein n=1 Tax=Ignelater luminosus TaxID=2038154 RepID=A0A8K0CYX6_IGNLU|nr:hypothetical protein ILUMI_12782 [Ignelater luminosus]
MVAVGPPPFTKSIGITAAVLGIVQGATWIILTFLAALIYLKAWEPDVLNTEPKTYGQAVSAAMGMYLISDVKIDDVYISAKEFFGWLILYFIISIIWVVISSVQITGILQEQKGKTIKMIFFAWAIWTTIICICDIILASLLAADYDYTVQEINKIGDSVIFSAANFFPLAIGIVMTIAARGFILWIVNITLAVIIVKLGLNADKLPEVNLNTNRYNDNMETFGRVNTPNKGFNNPSYNWSDERPTFNRNDSYPNPYSREGPANFSKLPPISSTNERLAKIGRQGAKSPPQNIAPPKVPAKSYIYPTQPRVPSPDYSPPNSPTHTQLKPALKNRQQNAYGGYPGSRH